MSDTITAVALIPDGTESYLNQRQREDYKDHREDSLPWCLTQGKEPETNTGYSESTMKVRHYRVNNFHEWLWEGREYTTSATHDDADSYMRG